ncbi:MAG: hypothetical protein WKF40_07025 [Thermoleophilaceae bacterium]
MDADGMTNYMEAHGEGRVASWPPANINRVFTDLDFLDPDVDGDMLLDGEDDQDNDDRTNIDEMYLGGRRFESSVQPLPARGLPDLPASLVREELTGVQAAPPPGCDARRRSSRTAEADRRSASNADVLLPRITRDTLARWPK